MIRIEKDVEKLLVPTKTTSLLTRWLAPHEYIPIHTMLQGKITFVDNTSTKVTFLKDYGYWGFFLTPEAVAAFESVGGISERLVNRRRSVSNWGKFTPEDPYIPYSLQRVRESNPTLFNGYVIILQSVSPSTRELRRVGIKFIELMLPKNFKEDVLGR